MSGKSGAAGGAITGASIGARTGPLAPFAVPIGAGVGALVGYFAGRKKKSKKTTGSGTNPEELLQLLVQQNLQQTQAQQPLRDAVTGMAMNRLRAVYPNGVPGMSSVMPPTTPATSQTSRTVDPLAGLLDYLTNRNRLGLDRPERY